MSTATVLCRVTTPEGKLREQPLRGTGPFALGRDPDSDVQLASPKVSRRHAMIQMQGGRVHLTDCSANGTVVGERIVQGATVALEEATIVRIGPYAVDFRLVAVPAATPPPATAPAWTGDQELVPIEVRRRIHRVLLDELDLGEVKSRRLDEKAMRPKVREALGRVLGQIAPYLPSSAAASRLIDELADEVLGLGPLEALIADPTVSEIMVVDPKTIYVERKGKLELSQYRFTDDDTVRAVIERIVTPLGRRIDESSPIVDARLPDGSRVNAVIPPLALRGPCLTIRKFVHSLLGVDDLIRIGSMTAAMAKFLRRCVMAKKNVVVSGGTGSGKTTLLNILSGAIPGDERIVTIEDAAELKLSQPHVVSLESRPANMEGTGQITIRDLVRNALRMRPDRIVVGECRGGEALDMLQAMNTGHEGSMTTTHANSPREAISRLETLALMAGLDLPARAIREQLVTSLDVIVQITRFSDGTRRVTSISEVVGLDDDGQAELRDIFTFERTGTGDRGEVLGSFENTGHLPSFLGEFINRGLIDDGDYL
jgi:pilus assembly protein CpaF